MAGKNPGDPENLYTYSENNLRCLQCAFIVMNEFPKMLQGILVKSGMPATTMYALIQNDKRFKHKLTLDDHHVIQSLTSDDYSELDLTLIFKIITNYTNIFIDPPTRGWNSNPISSEIKIGDDAQRLRLKRNQFFHKFEASISEQEFEDFFRDMADISARIDSYLGLTIDKSFNSRLQTLRNNEINTVEAKGLQEQYDKQRGITEFFVMETGEKQFRAYKTQSFADFITHIKSAETAVPGPVTLTFPELKNSELVRAMEDLRDDINKGLVNVKVEKVKDGSLIIQISILAVNGDYEEFYRCMIQVVLENYLGSDKIHSVFPTTNVLTVSFCDGYLPIDELSEKRSVTKYEGDTRGLQLDLQFKRDILLSDEAIRQTMDNFFGQVVSKVDVNHSLPSPVIAVFGDLPWNEAVKSPNYEGAQVNKVNPDESYHKYSQTVVDKPKEYDVFIVYSTKDIEYFKKVWRLLETKGIKCCVADRDLVVGQTMIDNINFALKNSLISLFIWSKNTVQSDWCTFEIELCYQMLMKEGGPEPVILKVDESEIQDYMKRSTCFDIRMPEKKLISAIIEVVKNESADMKRRTHDRYTGIPLNVDEIRRGETIQSFIKFLDSSSKTDGAVNDKFIFDIFIYHDKEDFSGRDFALNLFDVLCSVGLKCSMWQEEVCTSTIGHPLFEQFDQALSRCRKAIFVSSYNKDYHNFNFCYDVAELKNTRKEIHGLFLLIIGDYKTMIGIPYGKWMNISPSSEDWLNSLQHLLEKRPVFARWKCIIQ